MTDRRYVLTIATGKKLYAEMAANLIRSFLHWHTDSDIIFRLVTDRPELIPQGLSSKIQIVPVQTGELGEGFSSKLYLDKLALKGQTLFIDSDCLIFGRLDFVFEKFKGHQVSVVGNYIADGEWFGEIDKICRQFNLPHLPKFNGGVYYLENGTKAAEVYAKARELEKSYDEIGLVRLRNRANDELLMALAMQLHGQIPIIDDGTIMSDPQACRGGYKIDVIKGESWLLNPVAPHPLHQNWYPFQEVSPVIVHFLGSYTVDYPYKRESYRLEKAQSNQLNWATEIFALLSIEYRYKIIEVLKNTFRPLYHKVAGYRKIRISDRI